MNTSKHPSLAKKVLLTLLALSNAAYPLTASASQYMQLVPVRALVVDNGTPLAGVNVDTSNTTTSAVRAGNAVLKAAPSSVNFGTVVASQQSAAQTVTLSNMGGAPAMLGTLSTNAQFSVTNNCDGATLPSLGTCQINVTFAPTQVALGGLWGTLSVPFTSSTAAATALIGMQGVATWPTGALADTLQSAALTGFSGSDPALFINASGQAQIAFAPALACQQASSQSFTIVSNGAAPVNFASLQLSGPGSLDGSFSVSTDCPSSIAVGTSCTVTTTFAPCASGTPGVKSATLTVNSSSMAGNAMQVVLEGTAVSETTFSLSASQLTFGGLAVGQARTQDIAVLNSGSTTLTTPAISATGSFFSATHNCPDTLAPGASCTASASFAPTGPYSAVGALTVGFAGVAAQSATLSGQGLGPLLSVDALNHNFGTVVVGASATHTYTLSNDGSQGAPLSFGPLPATVTRSGDCGASLAVGTVCHLVLTYSPTSVTPLSGSTTVSSTLNTLTLGFTGVASYLPSFALSSSAVDFGVKDLNASYTQTIVVLNNGNAPLTTPVLALADPRSSDFGVAHNCASTLAPGASCFASVTFSPSARQSYTEQLSVAFANAPVQTAALSGTGQGAVLAADFAAQSFGGVKINTTQDVTYVLVNSGDIAAPLSFGTLPATLTRSGTCGATLEVGTNCTVVLTFAPTDTTTTTGALTVSSPTSSAVLSFDGTGLTNYSLAVSAPTLAFGNVAVSSTSTLAVRVTNNGSLALATPTISVQGTAGYTAAHNCPATLALGSYCDVNVTFAPTDTQGSTNSLLISYDSTSVTTVSLTGRGTQAMGALTPDTSGAFGVMSLNTTTSRAFTFRNSGNAAATGVYASISPLAGLSLAGNTCGTQAAPVSVAGGATCSILASYLPTVPATLSGTNVRVTGAFAGSPSAISLTGIAGNFDVTGAWSSTTGSTVAPTAATLDFGAQTPASTSRTQTYYLRNTGTNGSLSAAFTLTGDTSQFKLSAAPLAITAAGATSACASVLAADKLSASACTAADIKIGGYTHIAVTLTYAPTVVGSHSVVLTPTSNNGSTLPAPVTLTGTSAFNPTGAWSSTYALTGALTSANTDFATQTASGTVLTKTFYMRNTGTNGALAAAFTLTGDTSQFRLAAIPVTIDQYGTTVACTPAAILAGDFLSSTTCTARDPKVGLNSHIQVTVTYAPTVVGSHSVVLTPTSSNGSVMPAPVTLTGTAIAAYGFSTSASTLSFGSVNIGATNALTTRVTNNGAGSLTTPVIAVNGNTNYTATHNCGATLAKAAYCDVTVTFTPTDTSGTPGSLSMAYSQATAQTVGLTGTGTYTPSFSLSSSTVAFGSVATPDTKQLSVVVSNTGNQTLSAPAVSTTGAGFNATHNCAATLAVQTSCTVTLTMTPTQAQAYSGSLSVNFAGLTAQTSTLSGTGLQNPTLSASSAAFTSTAVGVAATAQTITVTNTGTTSVTVSAKTLSGTNAADFSVTGCSSTIAAGGNCALTVGFLPTVSAETAVLTLSHNGSGGSSSISLSGTASGVSFASTSGFISPNAGTAGTYIGTQTSTTILPELSAGYVGGASVTVSAGVAATEVYLMSSTASKATYLVAGYIDGYTKMVQVALTLSGAGVYAQEVAARYATTVLTTGPGTNVLTLWNGGATQLLATSATAGGYGATRITVIGH